MANVRPPELRGTPSGHRTVIAVVLLVLAGEGSALAAEPSEIARRVRPLLARCVQCHGGDDPAGELDLSTREAALRGGESGAALAAANPAQSLLLKKVASRKMPPKSPLSAEEIALFREWADAGAVWESPIRGTEVPPALSQQLWALKPIATPEPPRPRNAAWMSNAIDAFVLKRLEADGLTPAPPADRITLIRRATFDLTGLPPTPEEIEAFVRDERPTAYERLIDRLLNSPRYGERWGRHWLDVARFSESHGFEYDRLRDNAWHYRDYIVGRLNADVPYSQFVREQIAGDVLEPVTPESIAATGFLVAGPWDEAGNKAQKSVVMRSRLREDELEDMVSAVGQTFLGLTVNCARCHDHKFDPIPQRDYYRIKSALSGVQHGDRPAASATAIAARERVKGALLRELHTLESESARLELAARSRLAGLSPANSGIRVPLVRWTFEQGEQDDGRMTNSTLVGGASIRNGRLHLDGGKAYLKAGPLPGSLSEKTLEAWVILPTLSQGGGGVVSVQRRDGSVFDAIVFGEREPAKWVAGSDFFRRSRDLAAVPEHATPSDLIHVAVVYDSDGGVSVYRNGTHYAPRYVPNGSGRALQSFPATESDILLGLRHTGAGNGLLTGDIEEARVYDAALSAEELAASFRAGIARLSTEQIQSHLTAEERQRYERAHESIAAKRAALEALRPVPPAYAANPVEPPTTHVLTRGDVEKPAAAVAAGALSAVKAPSSDLGLPPDAPEGLRRERLAEWITHPDNPLTPRVIVNRIWHYHFGTGLVASPNDFGANGESPSHPELLDWLARDYLVHGTRLKSLHRRIMLSSTYRQSSRFEPRAAARDAETRLLWRFPPRRLEAEAVRDAMLAISGQLNEKMNGPSFRPFTVTVFNSSFYNLIDSDAPELARRTVYRINVNSAKDPLLETLDCPDPSVKTPRRTATTTPLQALALMNDAFVVRQARHTAERVTHDVGTNPAQQVERLYRLVLARGASAEERSRTTDLIRQHGLASLAWVLFNTNEFLNLR